MGGGQAGRKAGGVGAEQESASGHGGFDELIDADGGVKILEELVFAGAGTLSEGFADGDAVGVGGLESEGIEDLMVAGDAGKAPLVVDLLDERDAALGGGFDVSGGSGGGEALAIRQGAVRSS